MNLANRITMGRLVLAGIILLILVFPFHQIGFTWPTFLIEGGILIDTKYILCGVLFTIAAITDFLDGNIARSRGEVTDFGKVMDAIADKVLVNGVLIVLAIEGFIPVIVPVIIISRDTVTDSIKMIAGSKGPAIPASFLAKIKTIFMLVGIALVLFYNLPASLFNFAIGNYLILIATVLSVYSGIQYYTVNKEFLNDK